MDEITKSIKEIFDKHDALLKTGTKEEFVKAKEVMNDCEMVMQYIMLITRDRSERHHLQSLKTAMA
jgi:hypothetical protein